MKWLLVVGCWFLVAGNAAAFDPCAKNYEPLAGRYKVGIAFVVQKCGGLPNVVLGTMHSDDPKLLVMHEKALPILKVAKNAIFEIKFDDSAVQKTLAAMFFAQDSGKSLKSEVGDALYKKFMKVVQKPDPMNEYLKPWSAAIVLQYPADVADGIPLDMKLQNMARENKVNIAGLEEPEEQLGIFADLPKDKQMQMLRDVLDNYDENLRQQKLLQEYYLKADLAALEKMIPASLALSSNRMEAERLLKLLVDDRNVRMSERAQKYLEQGNAFIAIGALHLPGSKGVLKLLEDKGYRIGVIY